MKFTVRPAESWSEFKYSWLESMKDQSWFWDPNPADYLVEEELRELQEGFDNDEHIFLVAATDDNNVQGVLDFSL